MSYLSPLPGNSGPSSPSTSIAYSSVTSLDLSQRSASPELKSSDFSQTTDLGLPNSPEDEFSKQSSSSHSNISSPAIEALIHHPPILNSPKTQSPNISSHSRPLSVITSLENYTGSNSPKRQPQNLPSHSPTSSPVITFPDRSSVLISSENKSPSSSSHSPSSSPVLTPRDNHFSPAIPEAESLNSHSNLNPTLPAIAPIDPPSCSVFLPGEYSLIDASSRPSSLVVEPLDHSPTSTSLAGGRPNSPSHQLPPSPVTVSLGNDPSPNLQRVKSLDLPPCPPSLAIEPLNGSSSSPEDEVLDLPSHTSPPSPVTWILEQSASPTPSEKESLDMLARLRSTSLSASSPPQLPDPSPHTNETSLDLQPYSSPLVSNSHPRLGSGSGPSSVSSSRLPSLPLIPRVSGGDTFPFQFPPPNGGSLAETSDPPQIPIAPKTSIDTGQERPFTEIPSVAKQEWEKQKIEENATNEAIDKLMELTGLEEVKEQVLAIKAKADICEYQGTSLERERFNVVFQGNPGTGKTTVARIYAEFLRSVNVLKCGDLHETTGAELASDGPQITKLKIHAILEKGGGVLFVDEAYQLTAPHASDGGRQALDLLLTEMENNIGKLVLIFVGYNVEMESLFEHNPGLTSRIPYTLQFDDFQDVELWSILRDNIEQKYGYGDFGDLRMKIEGGIGGLYMRIAVRRLARGRGIRGFGNARSVINLLSRISDRQARRLTKIRREQRCTPTHADYFYFTKEDLIGPDPTLALSKSAAHEKLKTLIGLEKVKRSAENMIDIIQTNYRRELLEKSPLDFCLNRVLYGSPGTGKTTVAKLYGQILADLGLLSKGEVVVKNPADFIGQCLGKSGAKTKAILATTVGKVLIIDKAYMLNTGGNGGKQDSYKTAVIDTLVAEVQGVPGDDRCVLLLGYEDKIKEMFRNVNPGLARRFAIDNPFHFLDFDMKQLKLVLDLKMKQKDLGATKEAMCVALDVLDRARMRPNFANGGEVDNFLDSSKLNYQERQSRKKLEDRDFDVLFLPEDFDPNFARDDNAILNTQAMLGGRVGEDIIAKLVDYQHRARIAKACKLDPRTLVPTNFIFKGPPGTGKTTTARLMGKVYYDMGFLSTDEVIECSTSDLIGQFVGHTGPKTKTQLDKALGKVLLIDEAYRLTEGQYATEAVNELNYLLTTPKYAGKMIIILAGYTQDMNILMTARRALSTLFPEEIVFQNINPDDCITLLQRELKELNIGAPFLEKMLEKNYRELRRLVQALSVFPSWSNARDIKTLAQDMSAAVFKQILKASSPNTDATEASIHETSSVKSLAPEATCSAPEAILSPEQAFECMKRLFIMHFERCGNQKAKLPPVHNAQAGSQPIKCADDSANECGGGDTSIEICDPSARNAQPRPKNAAKFVSDRTKVLSQPKPPPSSRLYNSAASTGEEDEASDEESQHQEEEEREEEESPQQRYEVPEQVQDDESEHEQDDESQHEQDSASEHSRDDQRAPSVQSIAPVSVGPGNRQAPSFWRNTARKHKHDNHGSEVSKFRKLIPWKTKKNSGKKPNQSQATQGKQKKMGTCEEGFEWREEGNGWRCLGGMHFTQAI